ncbi:MAG TPA: MOSC domain-containing protein [Actinomycetota bacterium]|nr:MOSC domain-containing protein [Actinomycetota bacterium]
MSTARVHAIFVGGDREAPLTGIQEVEAKAGLGLVGDRYFKGGSGTFGRKWDESRAVTLIEKEAIDAANRSYDVDLAEGDPRRNIVTTGVALNHLVDKEFTVGDVRMRGVKLCEPCTYLEGLTEPGVKKALIHRGGLRAEIVSDGTITVGAPISI